MTPSPQSVTQMLLAWGNGDKEALDHLMPVVYDELRRQAARYLRRERPGHTLQTTALIHEAYIRLIDQKHVRWQNRAQFFGIAAQLMRRILVDHARSKQAVKRGGEDVKLQLDEAMIVGRSKDVNLVALDEALKALAEFDEQQSKIVELRYFSGLSIEETAEALSISPATVKRDWAMAKSWLHRELKSG
jgi:RNA polymerase sigma factor (TIGR02999 family)